MEPEPPPGGDVTGRPPPAGSGAAPGSRRRWWPLDPLVLGIAAVLVAFPSAATVAASRQPVDQPSEPAAAAPATAAGAKLRDLPAFSPGGVAGATVARSAILTDLGAMRAALRAAMERLVDTRQRAAIETLLADDRAAFSFTEPGYPFHYARIDTVLDAACPRCSTRCRPGRRTTWGHCSCWPRPVRVG